jgi:hypothetical protein
MALNFANNNSLSAITTASSSSTISFTSGIDDTYDEYVFKFYDIHGSADSHFGFNGSIDSGSNYNVTKTTTYFHAWHAENDADHGVGYYTDSDIAQGTGFQRLMRHIGADNDQCGAGYLHLFNPSSTTFAKNFIATTSMSNKDDLFYNPYVAGYFNSTSAIDAIQFKMESGNIDSGIIKLFGVS